MKIIVFEGVDKSGKSAIAAEFKKQTNFKHLVLDRAFMSQYAYAVRYHRDLTFAELNGVMSKIKQDLVFVLVSAENEVIQKRLKAAKHEAINVFKDKLLFESVGSIFKIYGYKVVKIDTSSSTVQEATETLIDKLKSIGVE